MPSALDVLLQDTHVRVETPSFAREADGWRERGDLETAREVAERGVSLDPLVPEGHAMLARICLELGDVSRAHAAWETTLRLDPHHGGALKGLAYLACQRRDMASALRFARAAGDAEGRAADRDEALALIQSHFAEGSSESRSDAQTAPRGVRVIADMPHTPSDEEVTVLVVDDAGLVVRTLSALDPGVSLESTGAVLSELGAEATRATGGLGLGDWRELIVDGEGGAVALGRVGAGLTVIACGDDRLTLGSVRFALTRGRARLTRPEPTR